MTYELSTPRVNIDITNQLPGRWTEAHVAASIEVSFEYGGGERAKKLLTATYEEAMQQIEVTL